MNIDELHEPSNARLLAKLPSDQCERAFGSDLCDICPGFLGFIGIYERLAEIIPEHWTVIDLGCAYAPQAFLFHRHNGYIGVDLMTPTEIRFAPSNARHFLMSISNFIEKHGNEFDQNRTFAICSYVPPWAGDNRKLVRETFENVFTFYPH